MEAPDDLKYSREHEWVQVDGNTAVMGITDYAQSELGDVVFVELPEIGTEIESGEAFGTIEAVKAVSELYSPLGGKVVEINQKLEDDPALVNQSPYGDGWMVKIEMKNTDELAELMDAAGYQEMVGA